MLIFARDANGLFFVGRRLVAPGNVSMPHWEQGAVLQRVGLFIVLTAGQVTLWVALFKMGISQATREHPAMACAGTRMACARHLMALMSTLYATQKEPIQPMHALIKKIRAKTPATAALTMTAMT